MTLMTLMSKLSFSNWAWSELDTATAGQQLLLAGAAALPHVVQLFRSMDRQHMEGVSRLSRNAGYMWKRGENQKHRVAGTYPKSKMYESSSLLISTLHNLPAPAKKTSCFAGDWSQQSGPPIGMPHAEQEFRVWSFTICLRFVCRTISWSIPIRKALEPSCVHGASCDGCQGTLMNKNVCLCHVTS